MHLSPLRKQVEILNKQLEQQNIQIKDLICFLNKNTPKNQYQNNNIHKSDVFDKKQFMLKKQKMQRSSKLKPKGYLSLSNIHNSHFEINQKNYVQNIKSANKQMQLKGLKLNKRISSPMKFEQKYCRNLDFYKNIKMTNSINFHKNKQNKKYLQLSRPQRKLNSSCSLCRSEMTGQENQEVLKENGGNKLLSHHNQMKKQKMKRQKSMSKNVIERGQQNIKITDKKSLSKTKKSISNISYKQEIKQFIMKKATKQGESNKIKLLGSHLSKR